MNQQMKITMSLAVAMGSLALAATSANAAVISVSDYVISTGVGVLDPGTGANFGDTGGVELNDDVTNTTTASNNVGWNYDSGTDRPLTTFDLGSAWDVQTIDFYTRTTNGTITSIDISVSLDDSTYSAVTNYAFSAPNASLDVSLLDNARYVRVTTYSTDWSMISEVDFNGDAVPEPTTTALLGLGGLALILRRRK
ncbi:MAG: discoidin domain-containing protein [Rubritalea sp.]